MFSNQIIQGRFPCAAVAGDYGDISVDSKPILQDPVGYPDLFRASHQPTSNISARFQDVFFHVVYDLSAVDDADSERFGLKNHQMTEVD